MSYVVTAGGTAGHIYPALAVASALEQLGKEVFFAGGIGGMEERMATQAQLPFKAFAAKGFDRQKPWTLLSSSLVLARSTGKAQNWLHEIDAEAVAAFGGYASVPVGRAALKSKLPLLIHEQNSHMGWTNRYLSKQADIIALAYESASDGLEPEAQKRVHITGNPVRQEFLALADAKRARQLREDFRNKRGFSANQLVLLIFGGSQGARHINQTLVKHAPQLMQYKELAVLHLTGKKEYDSVSEALAGSLDAEQAPRWQLVDYCDEMPAAFAASDLVLSRAGASSLAELSLAGKPSLLVPYPYATADHQRKNAASLVEAGAARMVLDADLESPQFLENLLPLVESADVRTRMTQAAEQFKKAHSASEIAELLIQRIEA